jgi:hypothetical protein
MTDRSGRHRNIVRSGGPRCRSWVGSCAAGCWRRRRPCGPAAPGGARSTSDCSATAARRSPVPAVVVVSRRRRRSGRGWSSLTSRLPPTGTAPTTPASSRPIWSTARWRSERTGRSGSSSTSCCCACSTPTRWWRNRGWRSDACRRSADRSAIRVWGRPGSSCRCAGPCRPGTRCPTRSRTTSGPRRGSAARWITS